MHAVCIQAIMHSPASLSQPEQQAARKALLRGLFLHGLVLPTPANHHSQLYMLTI